MTELSTGKVMFSLANLYLVFSNNRHGSWIEVVLTRYNLRECTFLKETKRRALDLRPDRSFTKQLSQPGNVRKVDGTRHRLDINYQGEIVGLGATLSRSAAFSAPRAGLPLVF